MTYQIIDLTAHVISYCENSIQVEAMIELLESINHKYEVWEVKNHEIHTSSTLNYLPNLSCVGVLR